MRIVADSSPLIALTKLGCLDRVRAVYTRIWITRAVYGEIVVAGQGMPGAREIAQSEWIEIVDLRNPGSLRTLELKYNLGAGEISTFVLAQEISADIMLVDDLRARRIAAGFNVAVSGTIRLLEILYERGQVADLRLLFQQLLETGSRMDPALLNRRLAMYGLPPR